MRYLLSLVAIVCAALVADAQNDPTVPTYDNPVVAIGLVVGDLDASRAFYGELLGFRETGGFPIDSSFGRRSGLSDGVPFEVVILQPGGAAAGTQLKLVHFAEGAGDAGVGPIQSRRGVRYLTLYLDDIAPAVARLRAAGVAFEGETPMTLGDGRGFALVRDPDGVLVELIGAAAE